MAALPAPAAGTVTVAGLGVPPQGRSGSSSCFCAPYPSTALAHMPPAGRGHLSFQRGMEGCALLPWDASPGPPCFLYSSGMVLALCGRLLIQQPTRKCSWPHGRDLDVSEEPFREERGDALDFEVCSGPTQVAGGRPPQLVRAAVPQHTVSPDGAVRALGGGR
jgi:hypothetical protein